MPTIDRSIDAEIEARLAEFHYDELAAQLEQQADTDPDLDDLERLLAGVRDNTARAEFEEKLAELRALPSNPGKRIELFLAQIRAESSRTFATTAASDTSTARQQLVEFAGGVDQLVDETEVQLALLNSIFRLHDELNATRCRLQETKTELFRVTLLQRAENSAPADSPGSDPSTDPIRRLTDHQLTDMINSLRQRLAMIGSAVRTDVERHPNAYLTIAVGSGVDAARFEHQLAAARAEREQRKILTPAEAARENARRIGAANTAASQVDNFSPTPATSPTGGMELDL